MTCLTGGREGWRKGTKINMEKAKSMVTGIKARERIQTGR